MGHTVSLQAKYYQFSSFGYAVKVIEIMQFACNKSAIAALKNTVIQLQNFKYIPLHEFPEPVDCYKISILDGLNLKEIAPLQDDAIEMQENEINTQDRDEKIKELSDLGVKGKILAEKYNLSESQISRIKNKHER